VVGKSGPFLGEDVVVRVLEDFKIREIAVINNFGVHKHRAGWLLKGRESIVTVNSTTNCCAAARECLGDVLA
jgi:hypothetical protein